MYMERNYIQHKFVDGMQGQRFIFEDRIILNAFNLS